MATSNGNKIGLSTAIIVGINAMIGSGIFAIPAALATQAGPSGILTTLIVGFIVWCLALSFAKVAELYPQEGSFYLYTKQWGGHFLGMFSNICYLAGLFIAMGLLIKMAGVELSHHFSCISTYNLSLIVLVALVALNVVGVVISELGQQILVCTTVAPLIIITAMCFCKADLNNLIPFAPLGIPAMLIASKTVVFSFFGFESAASLFAIVKNPGKNVPKALSYSLLIVGIIYVLFATSIILAIPMNLLSSTEAKNLTSVLAKIFPQRTWLLTAISISILSAIIGTVHSMIWGASRLMIFLANSARNSTTKKLLNKNMLNNRTAVILSGIIIFLTFNYINKDDLFFDLTGLLIIFAFITSIITLFKHIKDTKWKIIISFGLLASGIIATFAIVDLIQEFRSLFS